MHPDDTVTPGDDLLALAAKRADLDVWPTEPRAVPDALIDLLDAAHRIRMEADALGAQVSARLLALGLLARACRICGRLYAVKAGRKPRLYCRPQCELDSQTAAYRQREAAVSATAVAGG